MKCTFDRLDFTSSVGSSGELDWKGRPGHWTVEPGQTMRVEVQQGDWVAYDAEGNQIPMD